MSPQVYKSVYFRDYGHESDRRRSVTIAFGPDDLDVAKVVQGMASNDIRAALGVATYADLVTAAASIDVAVNTLAVRRLRQFIGSSQAAGLPETSATTGSSSKVGTFAEDRQAPFQRWFPFLEGYTLSFVDSIRDQFAPRATRVLDPFSGTGSTAVATVIRGDEALYCELNPVMRLVTRAKIRGLAMTPKERLSLAHSVRDLASNLEANLVDAQPDHLLRASLETCFGESEFFDVETLNAILRMRRFIDTKIPSEDLRLLVTVAALASLQPSSNLVRAGDLRYRKGREITLRESFPPAVVSRLLEIADDLVSMPDSAGTGRLLTAGVQDLDHLPSAGCDVVITSPPYLNGTNYFRNTKLELWFIRALRERSDLRTFRNRAITAGINDVSGNSWGLSTATVASVVEEVAAHAYDRRIPTMVAAYFADMRTAFRAVRPHLKPGASVLVDIGDSAYAGVHVPTDRLLCEVLELEGYTHKDTIPLRTRTSRSGITLSQSLLVMKAGRVGRANNGGSPGPQFRLAWEAFKDGLPHQQGDFRKRNWGHPLHSLCSYQGKMKPSLAHHLVTIFTPAGGRVLDPFAGVATIPFEASLTGRLGIGFEISPAAFSIATAKLSAVARADVEGVLIALEAWLESWCRSTVLRENAARIRFNGPLDGFFHPRTFDEVLAARQFFGNQRDLTPAAHFVQSCLLHILHGNRPYALSRRSHPITPFAPTGPSEYRALIPRLRAKVERSLLALEARRGVPGRMYFQDATDDWPSDVNDLDSVITSPPFFDSTRFYLANWMRLWFVGWERDDFETEPRRFLDERQKFAFDVYEPVLRQARERLKSDGVVVLHLGHSVKKNMGEAVAELARPWFRSIEMFEEDVTHTESHGMRDKGTVTGHQFLVLR